MSIRNRGQTAEVGRVLPDAFGTGHSSFDVELAQPGPFIGDFPHVPRYSAFNPGHEGSIEAERVTTLSHQKPTNVLSVLISPVNFGGSVDRASVPVKFHGGSQSQELLWNSPRL
jgi:hypothetical protein